MTIANDPTAAIRDATAAIEAGLIAIRRDIHAHPELAFEEVRTAGRGRAGAGTARHPAPHRRGEDRRGGADRGRPARPCARHPRRHGRPADPGGDRAALGQHGQGPDARLRPRHPHRDPARGGRGAEGAGAWIGGDRQAGVPARRGNHRRHEGDAGRGAAGRPVDRRRARLPQQPGYPRRPPRLHARPGDGGGRQIRGRWCTASRATPPTRTARSTRSSPRRTSSPSCRPWSRARWTRCSPRW